MVDIDFLVEDATFDAHSLAPSMRFILRIVNRTPTCEVKNVQLQCQVRVEPARRRYDDEERERLVELFSDPERWSETLRSLLWSQANVWAPAFRDECRVELPVPCSCDYGIAITKYFEGLRNGEAPLSFRFSGAIFYLDDDGLLQIAQIPWSKETNFRLPIELWRKMIEHHHQDGVWLRLDREVFERLHAYRRRRRLPSFDHAISALVESETEGAGR
jgi:hypothetical protein